jgi:hypothetical protein
MLPTHPPRAHSAADSPDDKVAVSNSFLYDLEYGHLPTLGCQVL